MPTNKSTGLLLILIMGFSILVPQRAFACSCPPSIPPAQAQAQASAIFAGKASRIYPSPGVPVDPGGMRVVTFEVTEVWKGPTDSKLLVNTAPGEATCMYGFQQGSRYLVYADRRDGELTIPYCGRTTLLDRADGDLAALGEGMQPEDSLLTLPGLDRIQGLARIRDLPTPLTLFTFAVLLLLVAATRLFRRKEA